jgi:antitoxin MazE
LKDGDEIEITVAGDRKFDVKKDRARERALAGLRKLSRKFPEGFVFDRDEANAR